MVEKAQPSIPEELSPSNIVTQVLSELTPQEEVVESKCGDTIHLDKAPPKVPVSKVEEGRSID